MEVGTLKEKSLASHCFLILFFYLRWKILIQRLKILTQRAQWILHIAWGAQLTQFIAYRIIGFLAQAHTLCLIKEKRHHLVKTHLLLAFPLGISLCNINKNDSNVTCYKLYSTLGHYGLWLEGEEVGLCTHFLTHHFHYLLRLVWMTRQCKSDIRLISLNLTQVSPKKNKTLPYSRRSWFAKKMIF